MENIKVAIDPMTYADIYLAAEICPVEISGLAKVIREGNNFRIFGEPMIPKQKCRRDGCETDFDMVAYGIWCNEMILGNREEELKQFKVWWHSHGNGSVYFSNTDEATISRIGSFYSEWWMHMVVNKRNHALLRLDIYKPERQKPVFVEKIKFSSPTSKELIQKIMVERREGMKQIVDSSVALTEGRSSRGEYND